MAILTLLAAGFGVLSAYLGYQTAQLSKQEKEAQVAAESSGAKASALQGQNEDLQQENADLRSQLGRPTASVQPGAPPTERRAGQVVLAADGPGVDLDAPKSDPQWGNTGESGKIDLTYTGTKVVFAYYGQVLDLGQSSADYDTCSTRTGYVRGSNGSIAASEVTPGRYICQKTGGNRYSAIKVLSIDGNQAIFDVVTYDPPFK